MSKIYFWQGILGDKDDLARYEKILNQLLAGEYKSADLDLKKLKGYRIYSVRVNHNDRLLFTTIVIDGRKYLLLIEVVLNHDYQKSRFLNSPTVLKQYLDTHYDALVQQVEDLHRFENADESPFSQQDLEEENLKNRQEAGLEFASLESFKKTFIELSDEQQNIRHAALPVAISGVVGSGKSCLALSLLTQCVQQHLDEDNDKTCIYLGQLELLTNTMEELWQDCPIAHTEIGKKVRFIDYLKVLYFLEPETASKEQVGLDYFKGWLKKYLQLQVKHKKILKTKATFLLDNSEMIYQEYQTIAAYDKEGYLKLGDKKTLFQEKDLQEWLYQSCQNYLKHLKNKNLLDWTLYTPITDKKVDILIVDETQDLPCLPIKILANIAHNQRFVFLLDTNQNLVRYKSIRPFILSLPAFASRPDSHIFLKTTFRCGENIAKLINQVIYIKNLVFQGTADQLEYTTIIPSPKQKENPGKVIWLKPATNPDLSTLINAAKSRTLAVITHPKWVGDAKRIFKTGLVFTPEEIKGMEYETIVLYRPFDHPDFVKVNRKLATLGDNYKQNTHRAKKGQEDRRLTAILSGLFVSVSRGQNCVLLIQDEHPYHLNHIFKLLVDVINPPVNVTPFISVSSNTEQDWMKEAEKQLLANNFTQVESIFQSLGKTQEDYERFIAKSPYLPATREPKRTRKGKEKCEKKKEQPKNKQQTIIESKTHRTAQTYIADMLANPSVGNWELCLRSKQADKLLFHTPYEGKSLIAHLFNSKIARQSIVKLGLEKKIFLTAEQLSTKIIDGDVEKTVLHYLCEIMIKTSCFQLIATSKVFSQIDPLVWLQEGPVKDADNQKVSPFFLMFLHNDSFFTNLFSAYPKYIEAFPAWAWTEPKGAKHPKSVLAMLASKMVTGREAASMPLPLLTNRRLQKAFDILMSCNKNYLYKALLPNILEEEFTSSLTGEQLNIITLLSYSVNGQSSLGSWVHHNPELFSQLPPSLWFKRYGSPSVTNFYNVARTSTGLNILSKLPDQHENFVKEIPVHEFTAPQHGDENETLLHLLTNQMAVQCADPQDEDLLLSLFFKRRLELLTLIPALAWTKRDPNRQSPLYNLTCTRQGRRFLTFMLNNNPRLAQDLPASSWYAFLPCFSTRRTFHFTALTQLNIEQDGCALLIKLLSLNPKLAVEIPVEEWLASIRSGNDPLDSKKGAEELFKHKEGKKLILKLSAINSAFIKYFPDGYYEKYAMEIKLLKQTTSQVNLFFPSNTPVKDKCEKKKEQPNFENALLNSTLENIEAYFRSPDADALLLHNNIKGCCLFARIINNQQGRNQLIKLAIHSPDLKILTANRLSLAINDQGITKTLLAYMCESKERIGLLKFLVNADMKELTEIPASIWLQKPRKQKGKPQESSPFFNCFIDSPELFISLFTQYPDYLKTFPEQAWTETGCTKDRLYQNISILSYLAHAKCDCLNKLLSCNDNYLYKMPLSNILQHTFVAGHYNMSVALALTLDLKGILILGHWLKHNPQLFRDLSHETWFEPHYLDKKLTSYAKLLMMPEGHVFISQLIHDEVIDFANKTSVETFIVPQSKDSRTVLSVLAADIELTVPLLCLYFEKNPGLATAIPASAWTYALENEDPPLHILTKCLTGIDFLSELLIKNPNLAEELPAEAWYRPYKKNPNRCPISQLVLTPHGLRLVLQLLDLNPKRACDFPVNNWVPKNSEDVQDNDITDWVGLMARNESGQELIRQLVCHNHQFITYLPQNVREDLRKFSLAAGYTQNGFFETVPESKQTPKTRQLPKGLGN